MSTAATVEDALGVVRPRVISFELDGITPSLNQTHARHWSIMVDHKRRISSEIAIALGMKRPLPPFAKARIEITVYVRGRRPDPDNLAGSVKPLIDCLKPIGTPSFRSNGKMVVPNRFGLGVIEDDGPEYIELETRSVSVGAKERCRTVVVITEVVQ
jgi:hypothetical protein